MKTLKESLQELTLIQRRKHHPLIHEIHEKHKLSKRTLFYVKEYGPHSNVPRTIVKESLKVLLFASLLSSLGGFTLEGIKEVFVTIVPLIILLPALNSMIGSYGSIISSKFTTLLHTGRLRGDWHKNAELRRLFLQVLLLSVITAFLTVIMAFLLSLASGFNLTLETALKVSFITGVDVILLVCILFLISITAGFYFYKRNEDPDNFLIPITTSIADFGNMLLLTGLVILLF